MNYLPRFDKFLSGITAENRRSQQEKHSLHDILYLAWFSYSSFNSLYYLIQIILLNLSCILRKMIKLDLLNNVIVFLKVQKIPYFFKVLS